MAGTPLIPMIGYWRVSYVAREEIISPETQQQRGNTWARDNGRRIVYWIGDQDATGRNFRRRITQAIAGIERGDAAEIGCYNYKRWGRNALECLANVKRVEDAGGGVVSWTEPVDAETAIGRFTRGMAFQMAELESEQIGDGWRAAHASRVARGLPADGSPRFGYQRLGRVRDEARRSAWRRDPGDPLGERYVPDPVTGPVLAALYERYDAGEPVSALVRWLNGHGVLTASGGRWTRDSLHGVLASGFAAGWLRVHDPACTKRHHREDPKCPRMIYVPGAHEPVISRELWEAFLRRQDARRDVPMRLRDPAYPLSGLLFCGGSGHRLTVTTDSGGAAYRCPRKAEGRGCEGAYVRASVAEETVLAWLAGWAEDIEAAAAVEAARLRTATRAQVRGDSLAKREAALQKQLARLYARWAADEHMEETAYELARAPVLADLEAVRARMRDAERTKTANAGAYQPVVVGLLEEWPTFPPSRRREMLGHLIARVEVHRTGSRKPPRLVIVPVWES